MQLLISYVKQGLVSVDAPDFEVINMTDPEGEVIDVPMDFGSGTPSIHSKINDGVNSIFRQHPVTLDTPAKQAYVEWFFGHLARCAKQQYPEFQGLELTANCMQNLSQQGIDLSFLAQRE